MIKRPLLIDCDPGMDDAFALLLAASRPEIKIVAVNPVAGNVPLQDTNRNALHLVGLLGLDCRVGMGAEQPLVRSQQTAAEVHGNDGMGGVTIPSQPAKQDACYAWDVLYEEAMRAKGELEVIALGPLTNIATAILLYPDLAARIKKLTVMGGSATGGNSSAYAEFNIWADPDACQVVLESGIPMVFCGLDGIHSVCMDKEELFSFAHALGDRVGFIAKVADFMIQNVQDSGEPMFHICDLATMACLLDSSLAQYNFCYVACETKSTLSAGQTLVDLYHLSGEEPNVHWMTAMNKERYMALLADMAKYYAS